MKSAAPLTPQHRGASARARPVAVLIIDADPVERRNLAGMIAARGEGRFTASPFASAAEAEKALSALPDSIVLANLETIGGAEALSAMMRERATIATSTNPSLSVAVAAMQRGAADFLAKPIGARALIDHLTAVLSVRPAAPTPPPALAPRQPPDQPRDQPRDTDFAGFIGRSPVMQAVYERIRRIAPSRAPVFITGESGTGKEVAADAIRAGLAAAAGAPLPFVALNCSAIPRDLMESEIFGHVRGAFTGASEARAGAAELADGGMLFLDEITEMDVSMQAKLLRFVQTGEFRRVGGSEAIRVGVRIVSATNRNPAVEVERGRLRADLFHRLHVLPLHMPALRERGDDVERLAEAFLARFAREEGRAIAGFAADALAMLKRNSWPGNVRELANAVRRAVVLHDGPLVVASMLDVPTVTGNTPPAAAMKTADPDIRAVAPYRQQERTIIEEALAACGGNIARAAAALDISPATIYRKRQAWQAARPATA